MIEEIKLNGLDNKPIKTTKKPPPRSINKNLMKREITDLPVYHI